MRDFAVQVAVSVVKLAFIVIASLVVSAGVWAADAKNDTLPNFDKRTAAPGEPGVKGAAGLAAHAQLRARVTEVCVETDPVVGSPRFISSPRRFLSGPAGAGAGVPAAALGAVPAADPHRVVKAFLNEYRGLFGHGAEVLNAAKMQRDYVTAHNGMRTVVWQQQLDGIEVFEAVVKAHLTAKGELINLGSQFVPDPAVAATKGVPNRAALQAAPPISAAQATANAAQNVGEQVPVADIAPMDAQPVGGERRQRFTAPNLNEATARLTWLPMDGATLRLCWDVLLVSKSRGEMFTVLIDAQTGEAVVRICRTEYASPAKYRVYTSDSPTPFSPGYSTPQSTQPPAVSRSFVTITSLSPTASPNGWIDDGVNETRGNNVDAHTDLNADNQPDLPRPQGSPSRVFDFPMNLAQEPGTYKEAAVTQLFYWCNFMHDKLYDLGFTEAAGNFQNNNFGQGGVGNDAVQADAQDGSGTNNANFSYAPADGTPGRMQMFLWTGPTPDRDGDFDAEVILHEYSHGLSNRLVGGGVGISASQTQGMGEGWGDFYGIALLSEAGDDLNGNWARGGYSRYGYGGTFFQNYYFGGRRYPYSTNMSKNPLTFKDIDTSQASTHAGIPASPIVGSTANEVHNMGEVWCVTLWEARANLVTKHGYPVGNQLILQLVTDGMKLGPANPTFLQARDAIIQADLIDNVGANRSELWTAFAKRGMGAYATSPSSSTTSGVGENFDLPDDLSGRVSIFSFSLDSNPSWTTQGQWSYGTPTGGGGTTRGQHDPTGGATGTKVYGVNLAGDYSTAVGGPYYLTTGPFNFTGKGNSRLRFQRWLNSDSKDFVSDTIEVSQNGTAWTPVWSNSNLAIADAAWTKAGYDISSVADNQPTVYVRWGYQVLKSGALPYSGWNIDDIEFLAVPIPQPPVISSLLTASATRGQAFSYQITATGGPTSYGASGLPAGVSVNTSTGLLTGTPTVAGAFLIALTATNATGTGTATLALTVNTPPVTLADALDGAGLTWDTSPGAPWFGQAVVTHDGVDAAASGAVGDNQESWLETSVTGPGTLRFWWKVSSESNLDFIRLWYDGRSFVASNSGEKNWQPVSLPLEAGTHTLRWRYMKDSRGAAGQDRAWVDEVAFTPGSPGNVTFVDYSSQDPNPPDGSLARPYKTVAEGYVNAANCGTLNIRQGTYAVDFLLNKCLLLEPRDGRVLLARHPMGGGSSGGEIVFSGESPSSASPPKLGVATWLGDGSLELFFSGVPGFRYQVLVSSDLYTWELWRDFIPEEAAFSIIDPEAAYLLQRFYKLVFP